MKEVLDQQVLYRQGSYKRVRQVIRGWHPNLGIMTDGWQGKETIVIKDLIRPNIIVSVKEKHE
jgi:hypothetical protein